MIPLLSKLLWQELINLKDWQSEVFEGRYTWTYYGDHSASFDTIFVEQLNKHPWIPDDEGNLRTPGEILFDDLNWETDPFLLSKIKFKLSHIDQAFQEAGYDPRWLRFIAECERNGMTPEDFKDSLPSDQPNSTGTQPTKIPDNESAFVIKLAEAMTFDPPDGPNEPVEPSVGGPETSNSADRDTHRAAGSGGSKRRKKKVSYPMTYDRVSKEMSEEFDSMLRLDYNKRCQICGSSFRTKKSNKLHIFTSHTVKPMEHLLTNHFGNLLSLCGWHFALISYGQWELLYPATDKEIDTGRLSEELRDIICLSQDIEEDEVLIPIRFSNLYLKWSPEPERKNQKIKFSKPHIEYLCKLLNTQSSSTKG